MFISALHPKPQTHPETHPQTHPPHCINTSIILDRCFPRSFIPNLALILNEV